MSMLERKFYLRCIYSVFAEKVQIEKAGIIYTVTIEI